FIKAIHELGMCYRHGWGVTKNKTIAVYYFEIAANFGDPDAQNDAGFCYKHGKGVKKVILFKLFIFFNWPHKKNYYSFLEYAHGSKILQNGSCPRGRHHRQQLDI